MASFEIAYLPTAKVEGGYSNDLNDAGGETIFGLTRRDYPKFPGWAKVDNYKSLFKPLSAAILKINADEELKSDVADIFKENYWDTFQGDRISNQDIANSVFDTGINMGAETSRIMLQQALNFCNTNGIDYVDITEDGVTGSKTLSILNNHKHIYDVFNTFNLLRGERYLNLMRKNRTQEKFWRSWLSRIKIIFK